jgi:hypothetical protein
MGGGIPLGRRYRSGTIFVKNWSLGDAREDHKPLREGSFDPDSLAPLGQELQNPRPNLPSDPNPLKLPEEDARVTLIEHFCKIQVDHINVEVVFHHL